MIDVELLSQIPLFDGLPSEDLGTLSDTLKKRHYSRGVIIFHEDDRGDSIYFIAEGRVRIAVNSAEGKEQTLAILGRGEVFGMTSILDEQPRAVEAIAMEDCSLLTLAREHVIAFLRTHPEFALKMLAFMCCSLRRAAQIVRDNVFLDVPGRLAKTILELAEIQGRSDGALVGTATRLNQRDIAAMVGATRESINKCLCLYTRLGLLRYEKGTITVLRPEGLRQRAC